ncbi:hypothetical protein OY671_008208, partial [Metschnikowia pulcherrima]
WWFRLGQGGGAEPLRAVDPDGTSTRRFAPEQIVGSVVYTTAMMQAPAHVTVTQRQSLVIGAIGSDNRERVEHSARVSVACGIDVTVSERIVDAVWAKAALNSATNPSSVVAQAGSGDSCSDARSVPIVSNILDETWRVAARYNACPPMTHDEMSGRGRSAGAFRTSMSEDYSKGRPSESSSIADAVFEMAGEIGMDSPVSRAIVDMAQAPMTMAVGADEAALRRELTDFYHLVAWFGWDEIIFNHISSRVPGAVHAYLVNPFGLAYEEITPESLVKVDTDGNSSEDNGYKANPAGFA